MSHCRIASRKVISFLSHACTVSPKWSGISICGLPNRTPLAFAAAIPSACLWRILLRSFSATNDNTCRTISLRNVPIRSFPRLVSRSGISRTTISIPFLLSVSSTAPVFPRNYVPVCLCSWYRAGHLFSVSVSAVYIVGGRNLFPTAYPYKCFSPKLLFPAAQWSVCLHSARGCWREHSHKLSSNNHPFLLILA